MPRPSLTRQLHSPGEFELLTSDHFDKQEIVEFSTREGRGRVESGEGGWRVKKEGWRVTREDGGWRVGRLKSE